MARRGRPTEQARPVTRTLHVRLTEAEHAALHRLAQGMGVTVSRLLRRAVREMVTGAPDPFEDELELLSRLAAGLGAAGRIGAGVAAEDVEKLRTAIATLVKAGRQRWAPVLER